MLTGTVDGMNSSSAARFFPGIFAKRNGNGSHAHISGPPYDESESSSENAGVPKVAEAQISDEALMRRLQEKDISALGLLYRRYARLVYSACERILGDPIEAQDLVHEVFLSLYKRCGSFDPEKGTARSWLLQLTYHRCFDWRDYLRARHGFHQGNGDEGRPVFSSELMSEPINNHDPVEQSIRIDLVKRVKEGFTRLPREQRLAFKLRAEGFSFAEIAQKLGCSDGNAKNHVYRGVRRLREIVFNGNGLGLAPLARQAIKLNLKNAIQ